MAQPTPIELLESKQIELEKALHKSFESFKAGIIDEETHAKHKANLNPLIFKYKQTIHLVKQLID